MPSSCCVPGCKSNYYKGEYVSVFSFPCDEEKRKLWLKEISRENLKVTKNTGVCIKHFSEDKIIREIKATRPDGSVLVVPRRKLELVKDAIPSIFPNLPTNLTIHTASQRTDPEQRRRVHVKHEMKKYSDCLTEDNFSSLCDTDNRILTMEPHTTTYKMCNIKLEEEDPLSSIKIKTEPEIFINEIKTEPKESDLSQEEYQAMELEQIDIKPEIHIVEEDLINEIKTEPEEFDHPKIEFNAVKLEEIDTKPKNLSFFHFVEKDAEKISENQQKTTEEDKTLVMPVVHKPCLISNSADGEKSDNFICNDANEKTYISNLLNTPFPEHNLSTQTPEKHFECKICSKSYSRKTRLDVHMQTHIEQEPSICGICRKSFFLRKDFMQHIRMHTGEKPIMCDICGKSFSKKSSLQIHMLTHTGRKPYTCNICSKSFLLKVYYTRHIHVHTGLRTIICKICNKSFYNLSELNRHISQIHSGESSFTCNICNKSFNQKSYLSKHMYIHKSQETFICDICNKTFSRKYTLSRHLRLHTCDICHKSSLKKCNLAKHIDLHLPGHKIKGKMSVRKKNVHK